MAFPRFHLVFTYVVCVSFMILVSPAELGDMSIYDYISYVKPPAVHNYKNENGDSIVCVKFTDQTSLHPAKQQHGYGKNSNIGWRDFQAGEPSSHISENGITNRFPKGTVPVTEIKYEQVKAAGSVNTFLSRKMIESSTQIHEKHSNIGRREAQAGEPSSNTSDNGLRNSCPEGTVPVLEIKYEQLKAAGSVNMVLRKKMIKSSTRHEYAIVRFQSDGFYGAQGRFNIWEPYVASDGIFSLSQIWLSRDLGLITGQTIEVGWQVCPSYYGDSRPRLFVYWTADGYNSTGCYNLECPGFVLSSGANYTPGEPLEPVSEYGGDQFDILISIKREILEGNAIWSLDIENENVGYWPGSLFSSLAQSANLVDYGGEVDISSNVSGTPLSKTHMGSGHFPIEGYSKAAYIRNIETYNSSGNPLYPLEYTSATNPLCYNITLGLNDSNPEWGLYMFFGGPGGDNPDCLN